MKSYNFLSTKQISWHSYFNLLIYCSLLRSDKNIYINNVKIFSYWEQKLKTKVGSESLFGTGHKQPFKFNMNFVIQNLVQILSSVVDTLFFLNSFWQLKDCVLFFWSKTTLFYYKVMSNIHVMCFLTYTMKYLINTSHRYLAKNQNQIHLTTWKS